jgi:hypothetical protein
MINSFATCGCVWPMHAFVHIVVLGLAVLVCFYSPGRSVIVSQFHDLATNSASPRRHRRRSLICEGYLRREGGPKGALEDRLLWFSCQVITRQGPRSFIQ